MSPDDLKSDLAFYRKILGKEFTLDQLLKIRELEAYEDRTRIIKELPELFAHNFYLMPEFPTIRIKGEDSL